MSTAPHENLPGWTHIFSGKVRDVYAPTDVSQFSGSDTILMVASDRVSAFDHVLPTPIPDKGRILTALSLWWFEQLADVSENHLVSLDVPEQVAGRAMITRRLSMYPIECVVRGYITGSSLHDYRHTGAVCGVKLPEGLDEAEQLPEPIFTPAAKAELGEHDENITFAQTIDKVGEHAARSLRDRSIALYRRASEICASRGIILADTKFEFGSRVDPGSHDVILADEVLTPDSSRFWRAQDYRPGVPQPSLDKQFIRNWLLDSGWDGHADVPELPDEVVERTRERYIQVYETLSGRRWQ
ncbi:MAG: phosphoribosylaminoimidazolesuccinocarboxamide synthase [Flaviflexus sp.]|nr:phosphoribosylaminoimidazolesuccinocarboxamide synthase [Flaviflexus sp.]